MTVYAQLYSQRSAKGVRGISSYFIWSELNRSKSFLYIVKTPTQPNTTKVGVDMKMTVVHPPTGVLAASCFLKKGHVLADLTLRLSH